MIMRFAFEVGENEKSQIEFCRNWFTGTMQILVAGRKVTYQGPFSLSTHFDWNLRRCYEFAVGKTEIHEANFHSTWISVEPPIFFNCSVAGHGYNAARCEYTRMVSTRTGLSLAREKNHFFKPPMQALSP